MTKPDLSRRGFLKTSGLTAASAVALTMTGLSLSSNAWSMTLTTLDTRTGKSLSALCRTLYPHKHLSGMYYDACVEGLDGKARADAELMQQLIAGINSLDTCCKTSFLDASAKERMAAVKTIAGTPFFNTVRSHVVVALYNNDKIWKSFGYQGPSFPYGGYLERGFNDINWLPEN